MLTCPIFSTGSIACDGSDNVYLGGTFIGSGNIYGVIVKLNSSGAKVWEREVFFSDSAYNLKKTRVVDIVVKRILFMFMALEKIPEMLKYYLLY